MIKLMPSKSWSLVGFLFGLVLAAAPSGCGGLSDKQTTCTTTNCAGCCEPSGACQLNTNRQQCGFGGEACFACSGSQTCLAGVCSTPGTGGGSGGIGEPLVDGGQLDDGGSVIRADAGMPTLCNMTCATCCDADGTCRPGTSTLECGSGGVQCQACSFPNSCSAGQCRAPGFDGGLDSGVGGDGGFDAGSGDGDGGVSSGSDGGIDGGRSDAGTADAGNGGAGSGGGTGGGSGGGAGSGGGTGGGSGGGAGGGGGSEAMPGDTCATAITLLPFQTQFIEAATAAMAHGDYSGDCGSSGGFGPDMVFAFTLTTPKLVTVYGAGCAGLNVSVQKPCPNPGSPLMCGASTVSSEGMFTMSSSSALPAGTYSVIVDTFASQLCGFYLDLSVSDAP